MPKTRPGYTTCGVCDTPDLKIMGTISVTGKGISGRLRLAVHVNPATGKKCPGTASKVLFREIMNKNRGWS